MGISSDEGDELPLRLSAKKRCYAKRSLLSSDSDESERKETSPRKRINSLHKETFEEGMCSSELNETPTSSQTPRSSERLRKKSSLTFSLPSRKEVLKSMSPKGKRQRSQEKIKVLKPRKLVNNFLRERSSYVSRGEGGFDSDDSGMSDFINDDGEDEEKSTAESDQSSDGGKKDSGICRVKESKTERKKKRILDSSEEEIGLDDKAASSKLKGSSLCSNEQEIFRNLSDPNSNESDESIASKHKTKNKRRKLNQFIDSDEDISSGKERNKSKDGNARSEDSESDDICTSESPHKAEILRPRSQRVKKLIKKQEDKNHKMFDGLLKKRQTAKLDPKERLAKRHLTNDDDGASCSTDESSSSDHSAHACSSDDDQDPFKVAAACFAQLSSEMDEDEDDQDFIVKDVETSDEGMNSDGASQFLKLLDTFAGKQHGKDDNGTQDQAGPGITVGGIHFTSRQKRRKKKKVKKRSAWKRLKMKDDSENSADDDTLDTTPNRYQPLHIAILEHDFPLVNKLIKEDPDCVYEIAFRKRTALHLAALEGQVELVKLLLKYGADQTSLDYYHLPALAYALDGHPECVQLLLEQADIKNITKSMRRNKQGMNLLHFAVGEGRDGLNCHDRAKCLELLFHGDKKTCTRLLTASDVRKFVPLVAAVHAGQHECVQVLLKMGAGTYMTVFKTDDGGNILHFAVECASHFKSKWEPIKDTSSCLRELLKESRLLIDQPDDNGFTPLMYACESGNTECVKTLLDNGASFKYVDSHGTSSLHLAAMSGDTECVQLLLNSGHQVDCVDKYGWPPLLYANFKAHESCVLALMKPKPEQVFVLRELLRRASSDLEKKRTVKVVKNVLVSLANHDAYYTVFNDFIRQNPEMLDENNYGLLQHIWRAILDFDNKRRWFKKKLSQIRTSSWKHDRLPLEIDRTNVLGSAMNQMGRIPGHVLRHRDLTVTFQNEPGTCTGPKREFFACFCKDAIDPKRRLFMMADDAQYSPVPNAYFAKHFTEEPRQNAIQAPSTRQGPSTGKLKECLPSECTDDELRSAVSQAEALHAMAENISQRLSAQNECDNNMRSAGQNGLENYGASQGSEEGINLSQSVAEGHPTITATADEVASNESGCNERVVGSADTRHSSEEQNNGNQVTRNLSLGSKLKQLRFIGRMVGFSIFENLLLDLHLSKPFVKQILGIPLTHPDDLSSFDYELHKNAVTWLQENSVNELDLSFSVDALNPWNSKPVSIELSDDCDKKLTDDNKEEYSRFVSQFKLEKSIKEEVGEFSGGLHEVIPREFLSLFTADEFSLLINGVAKLDVGDWKKHTEYKQCTAEDDVIKWFWNIVTPLKEEEKALLIKFSTGSPCVPLGGFAALTGLSGPTKFTISKIEGLNKIPMASTCFNMLKLTSYSSEKHLKDKLLIAIRHGAEGFSFS